MHDNTPPKPADDNDGNQRYADSTRCGSGSDSADAVAVLDAEVLAPPGGYGDGPVHIRVEKEMAGGWRPPPGYGVECNDWRCASDPRFAYVNTENTHNAFLYVRDMADRGVPEAALSVVRLPPVGEMGS